MDLVNHPLEDETLDGLIIRLMEELTEIGQAAAKLGRFGLDDHLGRPNQNFLDVMREHEDLIKCLEDLERRRRSGMIPQRFPRGRK